MEIELLKTTYFSKADTFLYPLCGHSKVENSDDLEIESFLFWKNFSVYDYKLIVSISGENSENYINQIFLPKICKTTKVSMYFTSAQKNIFIIDMSEWMLDIEMFIEGKYSKLSREAKNRIVKYHTDEKGEIKLWISSILTPDKPRDLLNKMTPLKYVSLYYEFDEEEMLKIGEIGPKFDTFQETLLTEFEDLCKRDDIMS